MTAAAAKTLYLARVEVVGGREGSARSSDGNLDVQLTQPVVAGADGEAGTNPEQLFAAAYGACFLNGVAIVARRMRIEPPDDVRAEVEVGLCVSGRDYGLSIAITVSMPGVDGALAREVVEAVHQTCPYSNATRGNIDVTLRVVAP
jgi:Ohr subfamily peroxiredoxin